MKYGLFFYILEHVLVYIFRATKLDMLFDNFWHKIFFCIFFVLCKERWGWGVYILYLMLVWEGARWRGSGQNGVHLLAWRLLEGYLELLVASLEVIGDHFSKIPSKKPKFQQNPIFIACKSQTINKVPIIPIIPPCCFGKRRGGIIFITIWLFYSYIFIYLYLYIRYAFFHILVCPS